MLETLLMHLPPGAVLILGGLLLPLLPKGLRRWGFILLPLLSGLHLYSLPRSHDVWLTFLGLELQPVRIDRLSLVWGTIFHIAAFLSAIYGFHVRQKRQMVAALTYAGSAVGAVFAGDLVTLFVYWELTAITSLFLIWAKHEHLEDLAEDPSSDVTPEDVVHQHRRSYRAGMRYVLIQVGSGVLLLAGILLRYRKTGDLAFDELGLYDLATMLIFLAFGVKAAFPLLHNWLQDAYPEATVVGTVFLSTFTTKMAIYALARGFPGTSELIWIGAVMTAFPIFFAVIVNDLRRVLAYSLNNQLGFMVVGIGLGTELSLNGTAAHAFTHILYKSLLFMSVGAVLYRTGTAKGSKLGGLYKSMPWTTAFCIVGAASISAFPLFSGFISKSLVLSATANAHLTIVWMVLLFASAGVFHHSGIKIPFFAFFSHDSGRRVKEAPAHMMLAMGVTAFLCIAIGVYPDPLYAMLPYAVDYEPYTTSHVVNQIQLLVLSSLAFTVLNRFKWKGEKLYPPELPSTVLDSDVTYRRRAPAIVRRVGAGVGFVWATFLAGVRRLVVLAFHSVHDLHGPGGYFARTWTTGQIAFFAALMLGMYLVFYLFN